MLHTIESAGKAIMNKWDWKNPSNNIPIFIHGPIGIGKTWIVQKIVSKRMIHDYEQKIENFEKVQQHTEQEISDIEIVKNNLQRLKNYVDPKEVKDLLDQHLLQLRLANFPIEILQGIPAPDFKNERALFLMNDMMIQYAKKDWCVIFLDEIDKATPSILGAATHLIESLRVGNFSFKPDTMIIACANRVTDSFLSNPLPNELLNRAAHLNVSIDIPSWVNFARGISLRKDIVNFIDFKFHSNQNFLAIYPSNDEELNYVQAFPTPRTCVICANQCDRLENLGSSKEELYDEVQQIVGSKFSFEFKAYKELYEAINIMKVLSGEINIPTKAVKRKVVIDGKDTFVEDSIVSLQYVYALALLDQVTDEILQNSVYLNNFINAIRCFIPAIKSIMMKMITKNDKMLSMICNNDNGKQLINDYFTALGEAM